MSEWERAGWTEADAVDVFARVDRWLHRWVPIFTVFVLGLGCGYAWCCLAFDLI